MKEAEKNEKGELQSEHQKGEGEESERNEFRNTALIHSHTHKLALGTRTTCTSCHHYPTGHCPGTLYTVQACPHRSYLDQ